MSRRSTGPYADGNYLASGYTSRTFSAFEQEQQSHSQSRVNMSVSGIAGSAQKKANTGTPSRGQWYPSSSPDVINRIEVKNSASSVVLAFRELQEKSKQIEFERIAAADEVDELRRRLAETKRNESLHRSRSEIRTTDEVLAIREHCERLLEETGELQAQLAKSSQIAENVHRDIAYQRTRTSELGSDIQRNHTEIQSLEYRIAQLQEDTSLSTSRAEEIERKLLSVKSNHSSEITTEHRMSALQTKINREKAASMRSNVRITALQKYMEIILQVNGDLTEALKNKQISSSRIFRIVESHTKHMAARDSVHYKSTSDLMSAPNDTSPIKMRSRSSGTLTKSAKATKSSSSLKSTKSAVSSKKTSSRKSVLDIDDDEFELSTKKKKSKSGKATTTKSSSTNAAKKKTVSAKGSTKKKKLASVLSILNGDDDSNIQGGAASRLYTDDNYEASLMNRITELRKERERYERALNQSNAEDFEAEARESARSSHLRSFRGGSALNSSGDSETVRSRSSQDISRLSRSLQRKSSYPVSESFDSSRSGWLLKPNLNPRYHDSSQFDATGGPSSEDRRMSSLRSASAEPVARGRGVNSGERITPRRPRSHSNHSRSRETGLVQTAGRLAATAVATAMAAAANAESSGRVGRIFVPSSPCNSKEFNVMASVSKAARSAREMNATLASRVKSLDFDGCGPQFDEIAKIDLSDMHDYLTVVKKLRESDNSFHH